MTGSIRLHITWRSEQCDLIVEGSRDDLSHLKIEAQARADNQLSICLSRLEPSRAQGEVDLPAYNSNAADRVDHAYRNVVGIGRYGQFGHNNFSASQGMPDSLKRVLGIGESSPSDREATHS